MCNSYFVTLSYEAEQAVHYRSCLKRIIADKKNAKVLICKQKGKTGSHEHYHLIIETDVEDVRVFRMRFRTYMSPVKLNKINLDIKHTLKPGIYLNYFKRDPSSKLANIKSKPWNMDELESQARASPDPGPQRPELPWSQIHRKLVSVGWKYPERPGKFLKKLSEHWHLYHIITNPKKLAQILRFESNSDDWDDIYVHADNQLKGFS